MGSGIKIFAGAVPMTGPRSLAEASQQAREGAQKNPGVEYRVEIDGEVHAKYLLKNGRLVPWVR